MISTAAWPFQPSVSLPVTWAMPHVQSLEAGRTGFGSLLAATCSAVAAREQSGARSGVWVAVGG